jgi:twinkle protein
MNTKPNPAKLVLSRQPCPSCSSSDAYHEWDDGHGYCFSCSSYFPSKEERLLSYTYEYLPLRGVTKDEFKFFDVKTKVDPDGKPVSIGFKYPNGAYKVRRLDVPKNEAFYTEGDIAKAGLFGRDKFSTGGHKYVTITEGELDALSLHQVLRSPVVSVQSASSAVRDCTADRTFLNSFERVYLAFDGDQRGREAARAVAKLFDPLKLYDVRFDRLKDANDYLKAGAELELKSIWLNAKKYLPEEIVGGVDNFAKILSEPPKKGIPYPFPTLTSMTYGMRTGESVLITAQEGVGKTEIMHAIEFKLLKETQDAVGAIYLEEPKKRHLQALAGLQLGRPVHLPDSGCTEAQVLDALRQVLSSDERLYLYSHFGSDDPEILLDTIRYLVSGLGCRWILLDHISMAVSGLSGEDERKALDYFSTRLEMMVQELDFGLIIVSHVNDFGQTRGSRYIGKIAHIRIDCTRDLLSADPLTKNTTQLMVSKNRFGAQTGPAGSLVFDRSTFTIKEAANDNTTLWDESRVA